MVTVRDKCDYEYDYVNCSSLELDRILEIWKSIVISILEEQDPHH